jgi:EAL domain-containing protein (putative c-di-GMP-specific phosphodiesterase class I)
MASTLHTRSNSIVFDRSFEQIQRQLQLIHDAGIKISLDDFGTGFANLSHLRRIPFDSLKIDQSFTSKILDDSGMHIIVKSLIDLAVGLEKQIICEGIETAEIKEALLEMGCKFSQGYLHSKGLPFEKSCSLLSFVGKAA